MPVAASCDCAGLAPAGRGPAACRGRCESAATLGVPTVASRPRARRVIYLFMHGGPSHVDLFDPKPELVALAGQPLPDSFGPVMTRRKVAQNPLLAPVKPFRPRGESGLEISDFLPHLAELRRRAVRAARLSRRQRQPSAVGLSDEHRQHPDGPAEPGQLGQLRTGDRERQPAGVRRAARSGRRPEGRPAGLGQRLPAGHVSGHDLSARSDADSRSAPQPRDRRRASSTARSTTCGASIAGISAERGDDAALQARIEAYELAFRMQSAAPEAVDLAGETAETLALYGIGEKDTDEFGRRCLLARRLVERGVRFVQLYSGDTNGWDAHNDVAKNHGLYCRRHRQADRRAARRPETARACSTTRS